MAALGNRTSQCYKFSRAPEKIASTTVVWRQKKIFPIDHSWYVMNQFPEGYLVSEFTPSKLTV